MYLPQFVIAVLFYSDNSHCLGFNEMLLGGVTMTLSCGSIMFGVVNGIMTVPRCMEFERNRRDTDMEHNDP